MKYPQIRFELVAIKVDLEKGQEAVERCISTVKANVTKEMQTWPDMAKIKLSTPKKKLKQMLYG